VSDQRILDRVRKLLAKAEGTDSEAEAEAFNAKAAELIAEYGIDRALAAADGEAKDRIVGKTILLPVPYARDKANLLNCIAGPLRAESIVLATGRSGVTMRLIGFESDLERIDVLLTSLLMQASRGVLLAYSPKGWESTAAYRRSWLAGFSGAVHHRLKQAESRAASVPHARNPGMSTELVLVDRKKQVDKFFRQEYPNTRQVKRSLSGSGRQDGYVAGQRADLGNKNVSGSRRALR
jgi:hypothetical protein